MLECNSCECEKEKIKEIVEADSHTYLHEEADMKDHHYYNWNDELKDQHQEDINLVFKIVGRPIYATSRQEALGYVRIPPNQRGQSP